MTLLLALLLWSSFLPAVEGEIVEQVVFEGSQRVSAETLRAQLRTQVGVAFSPSSANADMKTVFARFRVLVTHYDLEVLDSGGVRVVFHLRDVGSVRRIEFDGNRELEDEELREALGISERGIYAAGVVGQGQLFGLGRRLQEHYEKEGFLHAEINVELKPVEDDTVLVFRILEGPKVRVDDIVFRGLEHFKAGHLKDLMGTKESFLFFTRTFRREALERDLAIIEQFLHDEGYLEAHAALEELVASEDFSEVDVVIRIDQGPRYVVGSVEFSGLEAFTAAEVGALLRLRPGDDFRQAEFRKDRGDILKFYRRQGYIRAEVAVEPEVAFAATGAVANVTYPIVEDERKRIRDVRLIGNLNTADEVIRRELHFYPGEVFDQGELDYAQDRLRATGFFNAVDGLPRAWIRHERTDDPGLEDVIVEVEDGPSGFINFLAGVGSGTGFFVGVTVDKDNFDLFDLPSSPWSLFEEFFEQRAFHGGGQRLRLRANPGSQFSNFLLEFEEPFLTGPIERPVSLITNGFIRESFFRLYDEDRTGGSISFGKRITRDSEVRLGFLLERIKISNIQNTVQPIPDLEAVRGSSSVRGLISSATWNNLDFLRNPTEGVRVSWDGEWNGGPFGGIDVLKSSLVGQWLIPVYENEDEQRHVLEFRSTVAFANEYGSTEDVPLFERYFAGGTGTVLQVRGFDFRGVGPRQGDEPVGGSGGLTVNTEYLFPLYEYYEPRIQENVPFLKGVLFLDQGMLESDWEDLHRGYWRMSAGIGVRVRIPIQLISAPLEIYWGTPIRRDSQDDREAISINFSTRF